MGEVFTMLARKRRAVVLTTGMLCSVPISLCSLSDLAWPVALCRLGWEKQAKAILGTIAFPATGKAGSAIVINNPDNKLDEKDAGALLPEFANTVSSSCLGLAFFERQPFMPVFDFSLFSNRSILFQVSLTICYFLTLPRL